MLLTAEADQTSLAASGQHGKSSSSVRVLPEELHELVCAGISNAIEHAISDGLIKTHDSTVGFLEKIFMDEISGPSPQIRYFIRSHEFILCSSVRMSASSGSLQSAQRQYEQDVYNFSRKLGFPMNGAEQWVLKARGFWSGKGYNSPDGEESDHVSSRNEMLHQSSEASLPEMFRLHPVPVEHSDQEPRDITSRGFQANPSSELKNTLVSGISQAPASISESIIKNNNDEIEDAMQLMTENEPRRANQLQQSQLRNLEGSDRRFEDDGNMQATVRKPAPGDRSFVGNLVGHHKEFNRTEAVVKEKGEKAAKKAAKKTRRAQLKAEMKATRQAVEKKSRMEEHESLLGNSEREGKTTEAFEEGSQFEQLDEDKVKPQRQKKKARKRKRDLELPPQLEVQFGEHPKHKIARANSDAQDANSRKSKTKKGGSQYSPFFQRANDLEAEDDASIQAKRLLKSRRSSEDALLKAKPVMDFQTPMIQSA